MVEEIGIMAMKEFEMAEVTAGARVLYVFYLCTVGAGGGSSSVAD